MIRNPFTILPDQIRQDDSFVAVITIQVTKVGRDGDIFVKGCRSNWPNTVVSPATGIPIGTPIDPILLGSIIEVVAPLLVKAGARPDIA
jgi:hypothetical protein